jgi:hypothetical protein
VVDGGRLVVSFQERWELPIVAKRGLGVPSRYLSPGDDAWKRAGVNRDTMDGRAPRSLNLRDGSRPGRTSGGCRHRRADARTWYTVAPLTKASQGRRTAPCGESVRPDDPPVIDPPILERLDEEGSSANSTLRRSSSGAQRLCR